MYLGNRVGFGGRAALTHRLTKLLILSFAFFLLSCKDESGLSAQGICPTDLKKYTLEEKREAIKKYAYKDYLETINEIERTKKLRFHSYRIVGEKYPDLQPFWEYEGGFLALLEHLTYEQFIQVLKTAIQTKEISRITRCSSMKLNILIGKKKSKRLLK
jgi:hypothetical protein